MGIALAAGSGAGHLALAGLPLAWLVPAAASVARRTRPALALQAKKLRADVSRGEKIRASLPQAGKDCDNFYQQSFLDSPTGYSRIEGDLDAIATKSGVKISGYTFKQKVIKDRGVTEIEINTNSRRRLSRGDSVHQWAGALEEFLPSG